MKISREQCPWCPTLFVVDWAEERPLDAILSHFTYGHPTEYHGLLNKELIPAEYKQED